MAYCVVKDVVRIGGMFNQVINESLGIGNAKTTEFSFAFKNTVKETDVIYVDGTEQTRDTDYTINFNNGVITFLAAPNQNVAITADYKYYPDSVDITNDDIEELILDADDEIEVWTGKKYDDATSATEYFQGRGEKISASDQVKSGQFFTETFEDKYVLMLSNYPVQSITSLQFLDDDLTVDETLTENEDYQWWDYGKIQLITSSIPKGVGKKKVKIIYTYGYTSVPRIVKKLSATITAIMIFVTLTGGSFDEITSYTLGPKSVAVGEPYMNMREAVKRLDEEKMRLLNQVGREIRQVVI